MNNLVSSDYLTVEQVATMLQVSSVTIRRYIWEDKIPYVRLGRNVRIPKDKIIEAISPKETSKKLGYILSLSSWRQLENVFVRARNIAQNYSPASVEEDIADALRAVGR